MLGKRKRILPAWMKGEDSHDAVKPSCEEKEIKVESRPDTASKKNEETCDQSSGLNGQLSGVSASESETNNSVSSLKFQPTADTLSDAEDEEQNEISPINSPQSSENEAASLNSGSGQKGHASVDDLQQGITAGDDSSTSHSLRQSCFYGSSCYRKNPQHRREYAHPGDSDYTQQSTSNNDTSSDSNNRPVCIYGAGCYRKNPQHRLDFSHDVLKKRKARPTGLQDLPSDEETADFGEGSSDDYKPGDSESDESFITSDSMESGKSDFDPDRDDDAADDDIAAGKNKKKVKKTKAAHQRKKKQNKTD